MKTLINIIIISILLSCNTNMKGNISIDNSNIKDGDIIFHHDRSAQGVAVQKATGSEYTHVGIIFKVDNKLMVYEAIQPVRISTLDNFIKRGKSHHYSIKRLSDTNLSTDQVNKLRAEATKYIGYNYDPYFGWSDDKIYCSEYVWKIYKRALNIELCTLRKFKEFDLSSNEVKQIMQHRYGNSIPYEELVVAPSDIFNSEKLDAVVTDEKKSSIRKKQVQQYNNQASAINK